MPQSLRDEIGHYHSVFSLATDGWWRPTLEDKFRQTIAVKPFKWTLCSLQAKTSASSYRSDTMRHMQDSTNIGLYYLLHNYKTFWCSSSLGWMPQIKPMQQIHSCLYPFKCQIETYGLKLNELKRG